MTRSGEDYIRGLRDGRTVLFDGERVADVTTHLAFAAGIRTVARLYDLAHDPANRELALLAARNGHATSSPRTHAETIRAPEAPARPGRRSRPARLSRFARGVKR